LNFEGAGSGGEMLCLPPFNRVNGTAKQNKLNEKKICPKGILNDLIK
jgi:hypothetical protein